MKMNKKTRKAYAYGSTVRSPMSPDTSMTSDMNPMADRTQQQTVIKQTMPKPQGMPKPQERKSKNVEVAAGMPKMAGGGDLKAPPNPGAAALPKKVRNNMGFYAYGGKAKSKYTG
jgi:hypothetical protein